MNPNSTACMVGTNTTIPQRIENVYTTLNYNEIYTTISGRMCTKTQRTKVKMCAQRFLCTESTLVVLHF